MSSQLSCAHKVSSDEKLRYDEDKLKGYDDDWLSLNGAIKLCACKIYVLIKFAILMSFSKA